MIFDYTEDFVREHFSNVQVSVMGEQTLLQRILPVISQWESWIVDNMVPWDLVHQEDIEPLCKDVVIYGALRDAIAMLDVVLTPNGLATVGNNNLVPASSARSEAAGKALASLLFNAQDILLAKLKTIPSWRCTMCGINFSQSLFNSLRELCELNKDKEENSFDLAMVMQQMAINKENKIARCFVSYPLMAHLRSMAFAGSLTEAEFHVVALIRNSVFNFIRNNDIHCEDMAMIDVVNFIRERPEEFPIWHSSNVAQIFADHTFQNDPNAGGVFFR